MPRSLTWTVVFCALIGAGLCLGQALGVPPPSPIDLFSPF